MWLSSLLTHISYFHTSLTPHFAFPVLYLLPYTQFFTLFQHELISASPLDAHTNSTHLPEYVDRSLPLQFRVPLSLGLEKGLWKFWCAAGQSLILDRLAAGELPSPAGREGETSKWLLTETDRAKCHHRSPKKQEQLVFVVMARLKIRAGVRKTSTTWSYICKELYSWQNSYANTTKCLSVIREKLGLWFHQFG